MSVCELGTHQQPTGCLLSMNKVRRIVLRSPEGNATAFQAIDATSYETALRTSTNWDTEIAKSGIDKMISTPTINHYSFPETLPEAVTAEDGDVIGFYATGRTATFKIYKPNSTMVEALKASHNKPVGFFLVLEGGVLRVKKWETGTTEPFFQAYSISVGDLVQEAGANQDYLPIQLSMPYGAMDSFQDVTGAAFALTI